MWFLLALNKIHAQKQQGFSLVETISAFVILAVMATLSTVNLLSSQRDNESQQVYNQVRGALVQAQKNANRQSTSCTIQFTPSSGFYSVTGNPSGCLLESFTIDTNVVSITRGGFADSPGSITFSFRGTTSDARTLWITQKDFSNNIIEANARCIVISPIGMIRSGINNNGSCDNNENWRYDNS